MTTIQCPFCGNDCEVMVELAVGQHVVCPHCNRKFSYGIRAVRCRAGSAVDSIGRNVADHCARCGEPLKQGDIFCAKCGTRVGSNETTQDACRGDSVVVRWKWWKIFDVSDHESIAKYVLFVFLGAIVCSIGWLIMDASTCYAYTKMRDAEYLRLFGSTSPSVAQWVFFVIGIVINIFGIFYVYRTLSKLADRTNALFTGNSVLRKIIACVICGIVVVGCNAACAVVKAHPSIWDYLIMIALCRIVWRALARNKKNVTTGKISAPASKSGLDGNNIFPRQSNSRNSAREYRMNEFRSYLSAKKKMKRKIDSLEERFGR